MLHLLLKVLALWSLVLGRALWSSFHCKESLEFEWNMSDNHVIAILRDTEARFEVGLYG